MPQFALRVEDVGKKYLLRHEKKRNRSKTMGEAIVAGVKGVGRSILARNKFGKTGKEEFWALRDLSFEVAEGDICGVIGRNGAGKSTLLKLISRISSPTRGRIHIRGRVSSLLEVGTGFHPELTGRENIFLNGCVLGMSRAEITRKFDEIVAFSEVERFLDTPVKRYSSGMMVRLGFAVAAHLEPEILVVDEVLAVGDARFQRKCLGKMEEVGREGRTILFVSHNMALINSLCRTGIYLRQGTLAFQGSVDQTVQSYLNDDREVAFAAHKEGLLYESDDLAISEFAACPMDTEDRRVNYRTTEPFRFRVKLEVRRPIEGLRVGIDFVSAGRGEKLFRTYFTDRTPHAEDLPVGQHELICTILPDLLFPGDYTAVLIADQYRVRPFTKGRIHERITIEQFGGVGAHYTDWRPGSILPGFAWTRRDPAPPPAPPLTAP